MKIVILVPAFNEAQTLQAVLTDLKTYGYQNIIVGDDGSWDETYDIAQKNNVTVYRHIVNRGLGANLGTGLELAKKEGADVVVTFDADRQMQAQDIARLLEPIVNDKADVAVGNRMANIKHMPFDRIIVSLLAGVVTFFLYGVWFIDSQSGFRVLNKKAVHLLKLKTRRMEVSSEILKEVKRNKLRFASVPIEPIYTEYSRGKNDNRSNLNAFAVGVKMVLRLFR